ncbi:hypothetical protein MQM1_023 [Aeromonas phage vB_AsaP_MQM1]|nr:hypothetical protein MQM1_023 [Aeromonas phage vB_AsaP_MQM1]
MDIVTIISIIGALGGIIGAVWGIVMRPLNQRVDEIQETVDDHEDRIRSTEVKTTEHSVQIDTLLGVSDRLMAKMDALIEQLIKRS